jgi:hypothetical protein
MFTRGFQKIAAGTATIVPKNLNAMTGAPAMEIFGRPVRRFARGGRKALVALSRLRDGLR